ncbi:hypothetical protein [Streptomyces sp. NPDC008240]|uniref:hypothetical protein n=1 Tax=Streptomyces sp. NPDC008240 TaxID=3364822 RepID=UPI0036EB9633
MSGQPDTTPGPDGITSCGYTEDEPDTEPCGQPGTWHIAWQLATPQHGARCAFVCDLHMRAVNDQFVYADRHEVSPNCGMPGTRWFRSWLSDAKCAVAADEPTA